MSFLSNILRLSESGRRTAWYAIHPSDPLTEVGSGFVRRDPRRSPFTETLNARHFGLIYVLRGRGRVTLPRGQPQALEPGDALQLTPVGSPYVIDVDPNHEWIEAFIALDYLAIDRFAMLARLNLFRPVLHPGRRRSLVLAIDKLIAGVARYDTLLMPRLLLQAQALVLRFHRFDARQTLERNDANLIEEARRLLDADLYQRINLAQVAAKLGIDYHRFRRLFTQTIGISPGQYRIQRRIALARRLLMQRHLSVSEVARELGYPDPFVFSRQFKRVTGMTPRQARG